ncbi:hypothetical protein ACFYZJ_39300 [Streptomyces sp. NPDC001848]|uniref:hypothetical protein n=1 Tax=Streptomyces sp. NPDC001848 TaxID=3364618 RepID=UPI00367D2D22
MPHYHESFWVAVAGVAAVLAVVQMVAAVVYTRLRKRGWALERNRRRDGMLSLVGHGGYGGQVMVLMFSLTSLASETDVVSPMTVAWFEVLLAFSLPVAARLAEDVGREVAHDGDAQASAAETRAED